MENAMMALIAVPPEARAAMGRAARAHIAGNFDETRIVEAYRAALARAIS